jgi:hypothetical protein
MALYAGLRKFELSGGSARAERALLKRDRVEMVFDGTFYFEAPQAGRVRGAVFLGKGVVKAEPPPSSFERDNLQRMLKADKVQSDFSVAVLRFTDDSVEQLGLHIVPGGSAPESAQKAASDLAARLLKELGANLPARMVASILNKEDPGMFFAQFDKGALDRFAFLWDYQGWLQVAHFGLNGGEKGLFFAYDSTIFQPDIWMAFFSLDDYQQRRADYADAHELVDLRRYDMDVDVREWRHMHLRVRMTMVARRDGVRAVPFMLNETLGNYDDVRLKKALRLKKAQLADGNPLNAIQEDWDGSVTVLFPTPLKKGEVAQAVLDLEGEFILDPIAGFHIYYLRGDCWYPRHGYLDRAEFAFTFRHKKGTHVASIGQRLREEPADGDMLTEWRMDTPVPFVTFAFGEFAVHTDKAALEAGGEVPLDFYSLPGMVAAIKEDFILAEMNNSLRYFIALFGPYPYPRFGAAFHPFPFGQGFSSLLMIPSTDRASKFTYLFLAHETSHQWWGNVVTWRSYRDQWLSEGFAEYSGVLYTQLRDKNKNSAHELLHYLHDILLFPPRNRTGVGKGRLVDVGPLILGHRVSTRESFGAYTALTYYKGALVLRMLHFLFTNPVTGDGEPFFNMMKDFVHRHAGGWASTEEFQATANEHFAATPIAKKYQLKDLNWFFQQWVYQATLPSYSLGYQVDWGADGVAVINGIVRQDHVPDNWFMPLPLVITLRGGKVARGTVHALGPLTKFTLKIPAQVERVELDPEGWILAEKTTTTKTQ